ESVAGADFTWQFFNADGSIAEMCGNGARCAARFAFTRGIAPAAMRFMTLAGLIEAQVVDGSVKIRMTPPTRINEQHTVILNGETLTLSSINTGVPHAVCFVADNSATPVVAWGREIRHHEIFKPAGSNVNFVQVLANNTLHLRTYERGVEDETMACGTGAVAGAIIAALQGLVKPPVSVITSGGERLTIHFTLENTAIPVINNIYLEGPALFIYEGLLAPEALPAGPGVSAS
ncbi:MAG: diaminopimelate epimerase, partial [Deltaproteobacteria bacterium RIFOXYD12_FULL_50_9]